MPETRPSIRFMADQMTSGELALRANEMRLFSDDLGLDTAHGEPAVYGNPEREIEPFVKRDPTYASKALHTLGRAAIDLRDTLRGMGVAYRGRLAEYVAAIQPEPLEDWVQLNIGGNTYQFMNGMINGFYTGVKNMIGVNAALFHGTAENARAKSRIKYSLQNLEKMEKDHPFFARIIYAFMPGLKKLNYGMLEKLDDPNSAYGTVVHEQAHALSKNSRMERYMGEKTVVPHEGFAIEMTNAVTKSKSTMDGTSYDLISKLSRKAREHIGETSIGSMLRKYFGGDMAVPGKYAQTCQKLALNYA
jgi:hypothetical protein